MSDEKFHFQIPKENIRNVKYEKTGFSPSYKRNSYSKHGIKLKAQTQQLIDTELRKKDSEYISDLFLQIETPEEISIKSQKLKFKNLGFELLSFSNENDSVGTVKLEKSEIDNFQSKLDEYIETPENSGKSYFSSIENISSIPAESKISNEIVEQGGIEVSIMITLFSIISNQEILAISNSIEIELRNFSDEIEKRSFQNGSTTIYCTLPAKHLKKLAGEYSTIKEIKLCQTFIVPQAISTDPLPNALNIESVVSDSLICIVDSGISTNGVMTKMIKDRLVYINPNSVDCHYTHGTFVASRCVFGDEIENCLGTKTLSPYCNLVDLSVFGIDPFGKILGPSEFLLMTAIEDTVLKYDGIIQVYNLSLGGDSPIKDSKFSDLAKLLDYLSKTYKVLFIISSGNMRKLLGAFPIDHFRNVNSRISCPAESLLGLTVGSIAKHVNNKALSARNVISPFSRIGPGADNGIKPELVAHGGNLINPYSHSPRLATYGISKDGQNLAIDVGTSHSAPIIAQYAQKLFDAYPKSDPNLVKGLLCHFTEPRSNHPELSESTINYVGFGEPDINKALMAGDFNAAYIYEGELDQENYQFIKFHIPNTLSPDNRDTSLKVKATITYDPPVDPDNDNEYSESRISAMLFKNSSKGLKEITISSQDKYNLPWNPIIQFEKSFKRSYLVGPWELRLRLYTRGKVKNDYLQDYSVVIELIDENHQTDVYSDISREFSKIYDKIEVTIAA